MEEAEQEPKRDLPVDMYYNYAELHSKPFVTPDSKISESLLYLWYLSQIITITVIVLIHVNVTYMY